MYVEGIAGTGGTSLSLARCRFGTEEERRSLCFGRGGGLSSGGAVREVVVIRGPSQDSDVSSLLSVRASALLPIKLCFLARGAGLEWMSGGSLLGVRSGI